MATIREVAEKAGVSFTTVSHVINNTRFVTEETRTRVLAAMEELNYRPNALARSLRSGKTFTLGLILPDSSNPFFAEVGHSIEEAAFKQGYSVILCNTENDIHKEEFYVDVLSKRQVDGIIFYATGDRVDSLQHLVNEGLPVVMVDRDLRDVKADAVLVNNREGGFIATQHLIELGHRQIACITGPSLDNPSADRIIGYQDALETAGIPSRENLVVRGDFHPESGRLLALKLFDQQNPPTAIFACNDLMAFGVLRAATQTGLRVPEDLSVIGFDSIELAGYTNPPLTTIAQPKLEMGQQAVSLLMERFSNKNGAFKKICLPTRLVSRQSSGPASS